MILRTCCVILTESKLTLINVNSAVPSCVTRLAGTSVVHNFINTCRPVFTWLIILLAVVDVSLAVFACKEKEKVPDSFSSKQAPGALAPWSFFLTPFQHRASAARGGGTWTNLCWVCAAGLSEPLPHYSHILWPIIYPTLVTFG